MINISIESMPTSKLTLTDEFTLRPLVESDYDRGFLQLLEQLTVIGDISKSYFSEIYFTLPKTKYIGVIEDKNGQLVGTGSLMIDQKFIHAGGRVGFIEDIVVSDLTRGKGLGKLLIEQLIKIAREKGCYKVVLSCAEKNIGFYEKCGFKTKEITMASYFE